MKITCQYPWMIDEPDTRITRPPIVWEGKLELHTGVRLTGLYRGPRSGRMVARFLSIWEDKANPGHTIGPYYVLYPNLHTYDWECLLNKVKP